MAGTTDQGWQPDKAAVTFSRDHTLSDFRRKLNTWTHIPTRTHRALCRRTPTSGRARPRFTHWGQFGVDAIDLRVFDQDIWWVDRLGQPHLISEMSVDYIANVIVHLEENGTYFYYGTMRRAFIQMLGDAYYGRVNSDVVAEALGAPTLSDVTPVDWLASTPLMRRLRRLTGLAPPTIE